MFNEKRIKDLESRIFHLQFGFERYEYKIGLMEGHISHLEADMETLRRSLGLTHEQVEMTERRFVKPPKDHQ